MLTRNPLVTLNDGTTIQTIGDVHLGKKFSGVPLHKRGIFEAQVINRFKVLLNTKADFIVQPGDLFDEFNVDNALVLLAYKLIINAATKNPDIQYVILRGNHDDSKDLTKTSSFAIFATILEAADLSNVTVVGDEPMAIQTPKGNWIKFIGWSAKHSALELAQMGSQEKMEAIFGHWDLSVPDNVSQHNMIPLDHLNTELVVVGHTHIPSDTNRGGKRILVTGSLFPYAHGEQLDTDELFYTIKLADYDPEIHDGKIVRFILEDGESIPDGDFLRVSAIPIAGGVEEIEEDDSVVEGFDLVVLLKKYLAENGIDDVSRSNILERYQSQHAE